MSLDDGLQDQSYAIIDELQIRGKLEAQTGWQYEFTKGGTYDYDLELYRWPDDARRQEDRQLFGFLELERADHKKKTSWVTGDVPDNWPFLSFLKRKIYEWDRQQQCFVDLKPESRRALYLKFNHSMDNCFLAPMPVIIQDGNETPQSDGSRTNSYLALRKDHSEIAIGVDECVEKIDSFLSSYGVEQSGLEQFGVQS